MLKGFSTSEITYTLRLANKLLNCWIENNLPLTQQIVVERKKNEHKQKWAEIDKIDEKKEEYEHKEKFLDEIIKAQNIVFEKQKNLSDKDAETVASELSTSLTDMFQQMTLSDSSSLSSQTAKTETHGRSKNSLRSKKAREKRTEDCEKNEFEELPRVHRSFLEKSFETVGLISQEDPKKALELLHNTSQVNNNMSKAMYALAIETMRAKRVELLNESDEKDILDVFKLYLTDEERNDDDVEIFDDIESQQNKVLKDIKLYIKNISVKDLNELTPIFVLFKKIFAAFIHSKIELTKLDEQYFTKWAKIGLWLIEKCKQIDQKNNKAYKKEIKYYVKKVDIEVQPIIAFLYAALAFQLINKESVEDTELLIAENFLAVAFQNYREGLTHSDKQVYTTLMSAKALHAYKNGDATLLSNTIETLINLKPGTNFYLFDLIYVAANHFKKDNLKKSYRYYQYLLNMVVHFDVKVVKEYDRKIDDIRKNMKDIVSQLKEDHKKNIKNTFASFIVADSKSKAREQMIEIYIPSEPGKITKSMLHMVKRAFERFEVLAIYENVEHRGKTYNGIKLGMSCFLNLDSIIPSIKKALRYIEDEIARKLNSLKIPQIATSRERPVKELVAKKKEEGKFEKGKEKEEVEVNHNLKLKTPKRGKQFLPSKQELNPNSAKMKVSSRKKPLDQELHLNELGFAVEENPLVTPIYCSEEAQKKQDIRMVLGWEGIPGSDPVTEKLFVSMLNNTLRGMVVVKGVNQPGVKIWELPEKSGDESCGLRVKRCGHGGGFLRALAIHKQTIKVKNPHGQIVNCSYFTLGKPVHK